MAKKLTTWKTRGMNQDISVSAFNPEFAFENMNLRLSTNDGNTLLSWVNEKGTALLGLEDYDDTEVPQVVYLDGVCIGTATLNNYLVMFMSKKDPVNMDRIYRLNYNEDKTALRIKQLYEGDLNFSPDHPIETLVSYESEFIQKVYWTDGVNQLRLINIAPDNDENIGRYNDTYFDFVPTLRLEESVTVAKVIGGGGTFAPGVIQYAFTYYNKYGQESNIFHVTPLYYISHYDRGASPEDKVDNIFKITVEGIDISFDYLRIYSIQRTSLNATPICKKIQDIEISPLIRGNGPIVASYTDTGTSGNSIDPTELLYKGGSGVYIGTMGQKDGTLFMGDITLLNSRQPSVKKEGTEEDISIEDFTRAFYTNLESSDNYVYGSQLSAFNADGNSVPCAGFKHGDYYRCGIQLQDKWGRWTDPIFLEDVQIGNFPAMTVQSDRGEEYSDEDLELVVRFRNSSGSYITVQNTIKVYIKDRETEEAVGLDVILDISSTKQFSPGAYEFINAIIEGGRKYGGSRFVVNPNDQSQSPTPASVKDTDGNNTHKVTIQNWEDAGVALGTTLEVVCISTTNADADPRPAPSPEPEPVPENLFDETLAAFNTVLRSLGKTQVSNSTPVTYSYLLAAYTMAEGEYTNDSIGMFNNNPDIYNYRGNDSQYVTLAHKAMHAWLMAMCLSEIVPSTGVTTNNQTALYKKAYDLGGGRNIPLYGNFTPKGDVMLARLVAGAVYAKNRAAYSFSNLDIMRTELGGSVIELSGSLTESGLGYVGNQTVGCTTIGYMINLNTIFPAAAGPYLVGTARTQPHPSAQGQSSDLFYPATGNATWYRQNYIVDVAVDSEVVSHYNLKLDDDYLARAVQAVADEKDGSVHWFSERTYYKYNPDGTYGARFTFTPGTPQDNMGYFTGTFNSGVTGKDLSSLLTKSGGDETDFVYFMNKVGYLGGVARYPLLHPQHGRRRPGQGEQEQTCRCPSPGTDYNLNWLDDSSIARLVGGGTKYDAGGSAYNYYFIDKNSDGDYDSDEPHEPYYNDGWTPSWTPNTPEDERYSSGMYANTYPSGHSAGCWAAALFTIQFFPDHCLDIFRAAYAFSVSRTIMRAHWNSDITYGRLIGTMFAPIINAITTNTSRKNNFRTLYQSAFTMATGGGGDSDEAMLIEAYNICRQTYQPTAAEQADHHSTGIGDITFVIHNEGSQRILWNGRFRFYPTDRSTSYAAYYREPCSIEGGEYWHYVGESNFVLEPGDSITIVAPLGRTNLNSGLSQTIDTTKYLSTDAGSKDYILYFSNVNTDDADGRLHNAEMDIIDSSSLVVKEGSTVITGADRTRITAGRTYEVSIRNKTTNYALPAGVDKTASRTYAAHNSGNERVLIPLRLADWSV